MLGFSTFQAKLASLMAVLFMFLASSSLKDAPPISFRSMESFKRLLILEFGCYFYFSFSSIGSLPVQTVSICGYLEPLSALIFLAAILGEKLSLMQIAGAVLILGGAAFGELFRPKSSNLLIQSSQWMSKFTSDYAFSGKVFCGNCRSKFRRMKLGKW